MARIAVVLRIRRERDPWRRSYALQLVVVQIHAKQIGKLQQFPRNRTCQPIGGQIDILAASTVAVSKISIANLSECSCIDRPASVRRALSDLRV